MIWFLLASAGALTVFITCALTDPNGVTLIGCLVVFYAAVMGILHDRKRQS